MGTKNPATIFDVQGGFVGINDPKILASKSVQIGLKIDDVLREKGIAYSHESLFYFQW